MSREEKLNYLATTKDKGNKRYDLSISFEFRGMGKKYYLLTFRPGSLDFRFAH
jgi:hypothetical protein